MNPSIKNDRESSVELLRCISMFMVLVLHSNYPILGFPTVHEISTSVLGSTQCILQALSFGAVDIFLLISGYFSIKPSVKGITAFLSQVLFWLWVPYIVWILLYNPTIDKNLLSELILGGNRYWFVKGYLFLYVLAPVLNTFSQNADKRTFQYVLAFFFLLQVLFGIITFGIPSLEGGYSPISFVGIYLLGRYLNLHFAKEAHSSKFYLMTYFVINLCLAISVCVAILLGKDWITNSILNYMSPAVIIASAALLMYFLRFNWKNRYVNYIASSCFAVYLFHTHPLFYNYFHSIGRHVWETSGIAAIFGFLIAVFLVAVILDKIRILLLIVGSRIWKNLKPLGGG